VIVGPQKALACIEVHLVDVNWINGAPRDNTPILARLRNTAPAMPARVFCHEDGGVATVVVRLDEAQFGIAAGQAAAIYDSVNLDQLLGGGWIARAPLVANID
jgi:tRNA-specific 2-thiouridylase